MTVSQRIAEVARQIAVLCVDLVTILTETARVLATKADEAADALKDGLQSEQKAVK